MANRLMLQAAVAGLVAVAASGSVRADYVIDDFIKPDPRITYSLDAPATSSYTRTDTLNDGAGNITRTLLVSQTENRDGNAGATDGNIGKRSAAPGGQFVLNTAAGTTAQALLTYNYDTPRNLTGTGSDIRFVIVDTDLNTPFSVRVTSGTTSRVVTRVVQATTPETVVLPIGDFAGINLSNITKIELLLNGDLNGGADALPTKRSADLTISDVRITTVNPPAVPAPAALALFAAAVPVLGVARRFRR